MIKGIYIAIIAGIVATVCMVATVPANADGTITPGTYDIYTASFGSQKPYNYTNEDTAAWQIDEVFTFEYWTNGNLYLEYKNSQSTTTRISLLDTRMSYGYMSFYNPWYNEYMTAYFSFTASIVNTTYNKVTVAMITATDNTIEVRGNRSDDGLTTFSFTLRFSSMYLNVGTQQESIYFDQVAEDIIEAERKGYLKGLEEGYYLTEQDKETIYGEGYVDGRNYQAGLSNNTFRDLFTSIVNAPITYLQSMLGIELLGTDISVLFKALVTAALGIWIVRKFV